MTVKMFILLVFGFFFHSATCLRASNGCNKPFESQSDSYQKVLIETVDDETLGPVVREYIVQFPPGKIYFSKIGTKIFLIKLQAMIILCHFQWSLMFMGTHGQHTFKEIALHGENLVKKKTF